MSEWGVAILGLCFLSLTTIGIRRKKSQLAIAGVDAPVESSNRIPLKSGLFSKVFAATLSAGMLTGIGSVITTGTLTAVDAVGGFFTVLALSYLIHLWMMIGRNKL